MKIDKGFEKIGDLFNAKRHPLRQLADGGKKPPAYEWQELALKVIKELSIPNNKKSSVFKACKQFPKSFIETCLNDTKELCKTGERWKYFFKIVNNKD